MPDGAPAIETPPGAAPTPGRAADAVCPPRLYVGHVMHLRLRPKRHQFRQRVFGLLVDVDHAAEQLRPLRLISTRGFSVFGWRDADHGPRSGAALRPWVEARLAEAGRPAPARIQLLAMPRVLGYVFNPLSVYYCYDRAGALCDLVYEVKNTFGDQFVYVGAPAPSNSAAGPEPVDKRFFVSPFIDMAKRYYFCAPAPEARLALRIKERDADGDYLIATWNGVAEPLDDRSLARRFLSHPMMSVGVIFGIHWHALRLALKGVPFLGHPGAARIAAPVEPASG